MQEIDLVFAAVVGLLIGAGASWWILRARVQQIQHTLSEGAIREAVGQNEVESKRRELEQVRADFDTLQQAYRESRDSVQVLRTTLEQERKQVEEKLALLEDARERMNTEFKNIANEIFENKQKVFTEKSTERLDGLLKPLSERIKEFEKRVEEAYSNEAKERFSLIKEVKTLQTLNAQISQDAVNLTNALKGQSKTQGTWGEVILERVLEQSGLVKGREYEIQVSLKDEDGRRLQPDVIVHLPEEKDIIIDSKVSLVAYERYCSSEDEAERQAALTAHIQSLRNHIVDLAAKSYQNLAGVRTLEFVLLFVPIEAAFVAAIERDSDLYNSAFEKRVMVVAPSTLFATLRIIQNLWRFEQQNKNAEEIANRAGMLYDKFVGFIDDLQDIGSRIDSTRRAYDAAHKKLTSGTGNLVRRAEQLRELGAKVSKSVPAQLVEAQEDAQAESGELEDNVKKLTRTE